MVDSKLYRTRLQQTWKTIRFDYTRNPIPSRNDREYNTDPPGMAKSTRGTATRLSRVVNSSQSQTTRLGPSLPRPNHKPISTDNCPDIHPWSSRHKILH